MIKNLKVFRTDSHILSESVWKLTPILSKTMLCAALGVILGEMPGAYAQTPPSATTDAVNEYDIPAGTLGATLREISRVSGRTVRFESRDVQDHQAPAVRGRHNAVAAVQEAISLSGLTMTVLTNGNISVFMPELDIVTVTASRSEAETGFKASRSETATRSGADLLDVPQAVTVVTAKVIETQQAKSVQDVLKNVAGVVTRESAQGLPSYSIRGFTQTSTLSNGISDPYSSFTNIAGIDRVEVLKGPQAILSGSDSLGGAVNIVTKKPTVETIRDVTLSYGSHKDRSGTLDLAGALTDDKRISYRLIGSLAKASYNEGGYKGREDKYLLSQLRWMDEATDFTVGASYGEQFSPQGRYTFALDGGIQQIPTMRLGRKDSGVNLRSRTFFYSLEHAFSPHVTFISRLQRSLTMQDLNVFLPLYPRSVANMTINYSNTNNVTDIRTTSGDHYLRFDFETGPFSHTLSTGINHTRSQTTIDTYSMGNGSPVSVYDNGQYDFIPLERNDSNLYSYYSGREQQYGLFAQELLRFGDWNLLVGLRRTKYESGPYSIDYKQYNTVSDTSKESMSQTSPNLGLVYNVTANTSLYVSYSQGFSPQFTSTTRCGGGTNYDPMETVNKEVGFKHNSSDGAFGLSSALFQLDQNNRLEYNNAGSCYYQRGAKRVRGFEFESSGRLAEGWNVILNYTFTDSKDREKSTELAGAEPEHQASLWTTYDFQSGNLSGFGVSGGITAYSESRLGTAESDPMVPGGARVDVGASYARDDWSLRLGVQNLFDRELYGYSVTTLYVPVKQGRTGTLTFTKSF
ncbi:TPA: TonB-dependent siderophore receptor [Klebsiella michiganensis]|uniref:TonB-dependent siderophore receptor n=1 Tax=Enterobacter hormaechei TaxID=158836 RepID=UPI0039080742|nr:TonB-dependent receptor [Enterobacter hormaechei subsp. steigerwaltii]HAV1583982.1 TonB-dependent receptor [Enterobacter hormaechei subsp. steigerwaltii]HAV1867112.1 TonB-dependent receptor [Enterobacter hormaechei subsp. steigerwaltii]